MINTINIGAILILIYVYKHMGEYSLQVNENSTIGRTIGSILESIPKPSIVIIGIMIMIMISIWTKSKWRYIGCTAAIVYFTYQMGIYRKLPDLIISIGSNIPMPSFSGKDVPMPKPSIESTFNKVMEVPLTPLTIVTGVGSIVTIIGILRASIWILGKLRK